MTAKVAEIALGVLGALVVGSYTSFAEAQDASQRGKREAEVCLACHTVDKTNSLGPSLAGVVGRAAGSVPSFRYSRAMRNAKIVWDERTLDAYLADPQKVIPGNTMPFAGMPDSARRSEVIEYLKTLK
jgi:cytochrome c